MSLVISCKRTTHSSLVLGHFIRFEYNIHIVWCNLYWLYAADVDFIFKFLIHPDYFVDVVVVVVAFVIIVVVVVLVLDGIGKLFLVFA